MKRLFTFLAALLICACTNVKTLDINDANTNLLSEVLTPTKAAQATALDGSFWYEAAGIQIYVNDAAVFVYRLLWFDGSSYHYCYVRRIDGGNNYYRSSDIVSGAYVYNPSTGAITMTGADYTAKEVRPAKALHLDGSYTVVLDDGDGQLKPFDSPELLKLDDIYSVATVSIVVAAFDE